MALVERRSAAPAIRSLIRHCVLIIAAIVCAAGPARSHEPGQHVVSEYQAKAAFVVNFIRFVDWPEADNGASDLVVTVLGRENADIVERSLKGVTVDGRPLVVRRTTTARDIGACHVLLVLADAESQLAAALQATSGQHVLTVSELETGGPTGAIINIVSLETRLGFCVNLDAADQGGLHLSSKLLSLARVVQGRRVRK